MTAYRREVTRLQIDGQQLRIVGAALVHGHETLPGGLQGHSFWWVDAILPAPLGNLPGEVAIECDADGQTYRGSGIVEQARTTTSGQTTLLIRGNGPLDPEP